MSKVSTLKAVSECLGSGDFEQAKAKLCSGYPFQPLTNEGRQYTPLQSTQLFIRDGFVDRYSGDKLVFPGALRLFSLLLPDEFPFHPNWKMDRTHIAYWEMTPTVDHILPVSRGGADSEENWATSSMMRNSAKSNWTLEELGWTLLPPGDIDEWDGLMGWFVSYLDDSPEHLENPLIKKWHRAAKKAV